jgi:acetolactate synthase-1/2/3 large subunit
MKETTVADVIAGELAGAGARWVAGVAGGEVLHLADALARAGLTYLAVRHESAGGFVAEGAWHASGALPVLLGTVGPGATNALHVAAHAAQDRVPLIVITGSIDEDERYAYTHQLLDQVALYRSVAKASFSVAPRASAEIVRRAVAIALEPPFGPVHLDVQVGVARTRVPATDARTPRTSPLGPAPAAEIEAAAERLARAERPLVVAGLEALEPRAVAALRAMADAGVPIVTTYKAKGVVDERHERSLGGTGLSPKADSVILPLVARADVVLLAGYDPIEMRRGWCEPFDARTWVIDVSTRPPRHGVHRVDRSLVGDVGHTLSALAALAPRTSRPAWDESVSAGRASLARIFSPEAHGWGPRAIAHALRESWPDDGLVTVDTGAHRIVLSQAFESRVPHALLQSTGLCTMACALPLAIGASVATGAPVLAVTGDGGLDMCLGELATARDLGARVTVVVIDDASLGLIALKQRQERLPELGVTLGATDYAGLARAMGLHAFVAEDVHGLGRAIAASRDLGGPSLVHCRIARDAYDEVL